MNSRYQRITSPARLERPERRAGDDRVDRVQPEQERRDDAEVAAAAAQRPETGPGSRRRWRGRSAPSASTTSASSRLSIVKPALARQVADAAAEREPADAGGRDDAARRGQAERDAWRDRRRPRCSRRSTRTVRAAGSTRMPLERREVDHEPVVAGARARRRCGRRRGRRASRSCRARSRRCAMTSATSRSAR